MPKWNWVTRDKTAGQWTNEIAVWSGKGKPILAEDGRWDCNGTNQDLYAEDDYSAKEFKQKYGWTPKPGSIQKVKFAETAEVIG